MYRMIVCRSQTDAMNIVRLLTARGITAIPARPPRSANLRSCAWGVKLAEENTAQSEQILHEQSFENWKWMENIM